MAVSINVTQAVGLICEALLYGAWCFCLSDPGSSLTSLCRSLLRAIRRLCRNSHQKISSIKPSDLGCKLPPICNIDGSFCVDVQPFIAIGKCSVRKVRKRNFCIAWSKFDDFCG
ncbi:hypothetical protein CY34DRAFT_803338 [Suillus luteus UH-Slu-Lm8-n1]|uniref:Uncharacterized protein n=1 Tax=Suillus luteus UH-Slu-Lm8-n1 TaxID=930992 RepID=A0A0D0APW4_9AGAM|nr:hypothetical protein CY34DRAFT_803338 [Suillus luteus UH-Slu-Lm8-n1]